MRKLLLSIGVISSVFAGQVSAQSSTWQLQSRTDPMTDEVSYYAITETDDKALLVRCTDDELVVGVLFRLIDFQMGERRKLSYRFDKAEAEKSYWINMRKGGAGIGELEARRIVQRMVAIIVS